MPDVNKVEKRDPTMNFYDIPYAREKIKKYQEIIKRSNEEIRIAKEKTRLLITDANLMEIHLLNPHATFRDIQNGWQFYLNWIRENRPEELENRIELYRRYQNEKTFLYKLIEKICIFLENIFQPRR